MSTSVSPDEPLAVDVSFERHGLRVVLADGRELTVPLEWFPRLRDATAKQRAKWRLIGRGVGIHWDGIDEDISVESLLAPAATIASRQPAQPSARRTAPGPRSQSRRPRSAKAQRRRGSKAEA